MPRPKNGDVFLIRDTSLPLRNGVQSARAARSFVSHLPRRKSLIEIVVPGHRAVDAELGGSDPSSPVFIRDRLIGGGAQIDDAQPAGTEADPAIIGQEQTLVIGPAMDERLPHPEDPIRRRRALKQNFAHQAGILASQRGVRLQWRTHPSHTALATSTSVAAVITASGAR